MNKTCVIWGAGALLTECAAIINRDALRRIDYFVDADQAKWGTLFHGKPVKPPGALLAEDRNRLLVLVGVYEPHSEIELQLRHMGFEEDKHYYWVVKFTGNETLPCLFNRRRWEDGEEGFFAGNDLVPRTEIAMGLVRWEGIHSMLDLGAGAMRARDYLPEGVQYLPVDYKERTPETVVCDFNRYEFPTQTADLVFAVGVLGYVRDWKWFLDRMAAAVNEGGSLVVSALVLNRYQAFGTAHVSFSFECEVILHLQERGLTFTNFADWRTNTRILHFSKPGTQMGEAENE